jgi:excisionase family DNA binding protein
MRPHAGQLSLLDRYETPPDETTAEPTRAQRLRATRRDKPAETHQRERHGAAVSRDREAALLTTEEVAGLLRVNPRPVQRLFARGELSVVRIGSAVRFDPVDLTSLTHRLKDGASAPVCVEDRLALGVARDRRDAR